MSNPEDRIHNKKSLKGIRRQLRHHGTPAEAALWSLLKSSQLCGRKFRRQHSVGPYIPDFYCPAEKLAIELDGEIHNDPLRHEYDSERETYLLEQGITVVRFENRQVFEQTEVVLQAIAWHFAG